MSFFPILFCFKNHISVKKKKILLHLPISFIYPLFGKSYHFPQQVEFLFLVYFMSSNLNGTSDFGLMFMRMSFAQEVGMESPYMIKSESDCFSSGSVCTLEERVSSFHTRSSSQ